MSIMKALGSPTSCNAIPNINVSMTIAIWVQLVMALLCPWNSNSRESWAGLHGYRIDKAYHCKNTSRSEHEFIIVDLTNEKKDLLKLRVDRVAGERQISPSTSLSSSITLLDTGSTDTSPSSPPYSNGTKCRSFGSSLSIESMTKGIMKATHSIHGAISRLSEAPVSRPYGLSSNKYLAQDTVERIISFPERAKIVRTIEFDSVDRPSLWDLMIVCHVTHEDSTTYNIFRHQCFWFSDTIFALLERWQGRVTKRKNKFFWRNQNGGGVKGIAFHRRKLDDIERIWKQFTMKKEEMIQEHQKYERSRTQEARRIEELERQLSELKQQQERQRQERERGTRALEEKERQLQQMLVNQELLQQQLRRKLQENDDRKHDIQKELKKISITVCN